MATLHATPDTIEIQLTRGLTAVVDTCDADLAQVNWHATSITNPYARNNTERNGVVIWVFLHRAILERILGRSLIDGERVDHIDGDTLNNRRSNLRLASHTENMRNRKRHSNNRSGYKGVFFEQGRWRAKIRVNRKSVHLGYFDDPEEAYAAYCEAASQYHGDFAKFQ